ncbi:Germin-like protein subfamily 1 member 13 [Morella rubra]|uniref:Germin-like protein n=1 Tax=Morella rubra TaxID=262757 RepID=A0A6A1V385_9ROSI|nr:Germin-like protein subfamily 1 member 13 [Morella rubra]
MMRSVPKYLVPVALLALACTLVSTYDPSPLQDFCVAINSSTSTVFVNGKFYKDPKAYPWLALTLPPYGLNPPHTHPRGIEIIVVAEGTLYGGFVTSNTDNRLFAKVLNKGDVFVFPVGLIHFQLNMGKTNAVAFASLSNQSPRVITIANAVFGSNPLINPDVLTKAFQVDENVASELPRPTLPLSLPLFRSDQLRLLVIFGIISWRHLWEFSKKGLLQTMHAHYSFFQPSPMHPLLPSLSRNMLVENSGHPFEIIFLGKMFFVFGFDASPVEDSYHLYD